MDDWFWCITLSTIVLAIAWNNRTRREPKRPVVFPSKGPTAEDIVRFQARRAEERKRQDEEIVTVILPTINNDGR